MIDFSVYLKSDDDIGGKERYVLTKYLLFCMLTGCFLAGACPFRNKSGSLKMKFSDPEENAPVCCSVLLVSWKVCSLEQTSAASPTASKQWRLARWQGKGTCRPLSPQLGI